MAKRVVGSIGISLTANSDPFTRGFKAATAQVRSFESGLAATAKRIIAFGATYMAIRKVTSSIASAMDTIDKMAKTSDKLGIATEKLMGLKHAAGLTGVEFDTLQKGLMTMVQGIGDAAKGTGEAKDAIAKLGLSVSDLMKLSPDEQFIAIADAMKGVTNSNEKLNAVMDIFGKRGADLLNTLNLGGNGLRDTQKEADRLGITFSRKMAKGVEEANDSMRKLREFIDGIVMQIAIGLSPAIKHITDAFVKWATEGEPIQLRIINAMETLTIAAVETADAVGNAIAKLVSYGEQMGNAWDWLQTINGNKAIAAAAEKMGEITTGHGADADTRKMQEDFDKIISKLGIVAARAETTKEKLQRLFAEMRKEIIMNNESLDTGLGAFGKAHMDLFGGMAEGLNKLRDPKAYEEIITNVRATAQEYIRLGEERKKADEEAAKAARQQQFKDQELRQQHFDFIVGGLRDIVSNSNASAKEQFKINKALSIAETTMNTATAIMKYHSEGRPGMAIAAGLIGAAQIAAISSTTFEGGGGGTASASTAGTASTEPQPPSRIVNVSMTGNGRYSRQEVLAMLDGMNEAFDDGITFNVSGAR